MLSKGQKINDRYEIIKTIGEGGMANVYLANDLILDRKVAIKVLRGDLSNDEKFIRRFKREALSVSNLSHPNIVEVYDEMINNYKKYVKPLLHEIDPELEKQIDDIILNSTVEDFVYYYGCSQIVSTQEAGCDVLVSSDGVHFDALTRNGFNDKFNHGGRAFIPTDNGLFLGMANPFWGTQLWKITDGSENPKPETDKPGTEKNDQPSTEDKPNIEVNKPTDSTTTTIKPNENKKEDNKKVDTGDPTQIMICVMVTLISALFVAGLLKYRKVK